MAKEKSEPGLWSWPSFFSGLGGAVIGALIALLGTWVVTNKSIEAEDQRLDRSVAEATSARSEERRADAYAALLGAMGQWLSDIRDAPFSTASIAADSPAVARTESHLRKMNQGRNDTEAALGLVRVVGAPDVHRGAEECNTEVLEYFISSATWMEVVMLSDSDGDSVAVESPLAYDQAPIHECRDRLVAEMRKDLAT